MASAVGIDVGRASATAVCLRKRGASLALERLIHIGLDEIRDGGVDIDDPVQLCRALAARLNGRKFPTSGGNLGVSGKDAIIRYAHLPPMPKWRLALVMGYDIADVADKTGAPLSADFRVVGSGEDGTSIVLVAMAKDERVTSWVKAFVGAGVELGSASPRPTASGDAFRFLGEGASEGTTLVLDIGRSSTEAAIIREGALIFARSIAQGGDLLTDRIAKKLNVVKEEAERLKIEGRGPSGESLAPIMDPGCEQLASVARATLDYARQQLKDPKLSIDKVAVTGGAARTPGLVEAIGRAAGVPASAFDPLAGLDTGPAPDRDKKEAQERGLEATAACGLALARLLPNAVSLDLLPNAWKARREWRERTVWLYAAAACVALYIVVAGSFSWLRSSGEGARAMQLAAARAIVAQRNAKKDELAEQNANRAKNLAALAARSRPGFHLSSLIATLSRQIPPKASINELTLERTPATETTGPDGNPIVTPESFQFQIKGSIDNKEKDAARISIEIQQAIAHDPDVGEAKVSPGSFDTPQVEFKMTVKPKEK